jgi:cell shape-determining protein MreC
MRVRSSHSRKVARRIRILIISLILVLVGWTMPKLTATISAFFLYPVHVAHEWLEYSSSFVPVLFRDRRDLLAEIQQLEDKLLISGKTDLTINRITEENKRFRSLLGAGKNERIAAGVIARPNQLPYDLLQIDRGSDDGIVVGAPVFIGEEVVVGLIVHTAPSYSFVELFTTSGFRATAFILGPNIVTELEGMGGGIARVKVPQGVSLKERDLVILPSIEPGLFGEIIAVQNEPTQPEQFGYITPHIPISSLHMVSVGTLSQISKSPTEIDETIRQEIKKSLLVSGVWNNGTTTASTTDSVEQPNTTVEE